MKKKYLLMFITAILVTAAAIGGSLAATSTKTSSPATARMSAPTLAVGLSGETAQDIGLTGESEKVVPGDSLNGQFNVKNSADVPQFVKVTVTKYWADGGVKDTTDTTANLELMWDGGAWIKATNPFEGADGVSREQEIYYYTSVLGAGESAGFTFDVQVAPDLDNTFMDRQVEVEVKVDAVQYLSGDNEANERGIRSAWGVDASVSGQSITGIG